MEDTKQEDIGVPDHISKDLAHAAFKYVAEFLGGNKGEGDRSQRLVEETMREINSSERDLDYLMRCIEQQNQLLDDRKADRAALHELRLSYEAQSRELERLRGGSGANTGTDSDPSSALMLELSNMRVRMGKMRNIMLAMAKASLGSGIGMAIEASLDESGSVRLSNESERLADLRAKVVMAGPALKLAAEMFEQASKKQEAFAILFLLKEVE